jgi:hypothetical protein
MPRYTVGFTILSTEAGFALEVNADDEAEAEARATTHFIGEDDGPLVDLTKSETGLPEDGDYSVTVTQFGQRPGA